MACGVEKSSETGEWHRCATVKSSSMLVPDGNVWVEALDHQAMPDKVPLDSNVFGPVPAGCLKGKVLMSTRSPLAAKGLTLDQRKRVAIRGVPNELNNIP